MTTEKINKIVSNFKTRKNVTAQALDDLYLIFDFLDDVVDNINMSVNQKINVRTSNYDSCNNMWYRGYDAADPTEWSIRIVNGKTGIFEHADYDYSKVEKHEIDYINLKQTYDTLIELFAKLETISNRKEVAGAITKIKEILK